ncbi:MAG TPA: LmbE family protein [Verrucomicrobiales bacterium]|nr:LmbE family protein [Verrucomicrobiales bacterium]
MSRKIAMAIAAHPDDIEFMMGGTLILLKKAGYETHYLNLSAGSCGSMDHPAGKLRDIRKNEAEKAAVILGAVHHPTLGDDLEIFYELGTLRRLAAIIRQVHPAILLIPSPQDYMEDHTNTCRLAVTAAFSAGIPNFRTNPKTKPVKGEVTLYHAMPHGLRDPLRRRIIPGALVNTTEIQSRKTDALKAHESQQNWLDESQKISAYLQTMEDFSRDLGRQSRWFKYAEGWRRHLHYGFCNESSDPLKEALGDLCFINKKYEEDLEQGIPPR